MSNKPIVVTIRGKASYAKILGAPVYNRFNDNNEWKLDVQISPEVVKEMKSYNAADKVKVKEDYLDGKPFLSFKQPEFKRNGEKNEPMKVTDILGDSWDQDTLIGNGSDIEIRFAIVDNGPGIKKGMYVRNIRVLKLVPYSNNILPDIDDDDEFAEEARKAREAREKIGLADNPEDALDDDVDNIL